MTRIRFFIWLRPLLFAEPGPTKLSSKAIMATATMTGRLFGNMSLMMADNEAKMFIQITGDIRPIKKFEESGNY